MLKVKGSILLFSIIAILFGCTNNLGKNDGDNGNKSSAKNDTTVNSVNDVLLKLSSQTKTFIIDPTKEIVLKGDEGTAIYVPANIFEFEDGSVPKDSIRIQLKESYSLSSMIGNNLSTLSNEKLLQTAGMVNVTAMADGKKLSIKNGQSYVVGFPKKDKSKTMELFYQEKVGNTDSTWVTADNLSLKMVDTVYPFSRDTSSLDIDNLPDELYDYYFSNYCLHTLTFAFLYFKGQDRTIFDYFRDTKVVPRNIAKDFYDNKWYIPFYVNIDKNGKIVNIRVCKEYMGNDPNIIKYNEIALKNAKELLENSPPFDIESYNKKESEKIKFNFDYVFTFEGYRKVNKERYNARFIKKYSKYIDKAIEKIDKGDLDYYMFEVTKLGWINCDKFWDTKEDKINYVVKTSSPKNSKIQIVFTGINSIMNGGLEGEDFVFHNIPINQKIKVIGISFVNGKPMMSINETTVNKTAFELKGFNEFTLSQLDKELNGAL